VAGAVKAITHFLKGDGLGGFEQVDVGIFGAIERIHGMVGNIEFHDAPADAIEPLAAGADHHTFANRRGAGGRRSSVAFDLDQA